MSSQLLFCVAALLLLVLDTFVISVDNDGFIVDDNTPHLQQGISKIKKSVTKPVVRTMAMSSVMASKNTPKQQQQQQQQQDGLLTKNYVDSTSSKHIEPRVNLELSLKNLDLASKRAEIHNKNSQQGKTTATTPANNKFAETNNNSTKKHTTITPESEKSLPLKESNTDKKSASPNILTDATINGFLSKNPKYTIDSVGKKNPASGDASKKKENAKKMSRKTSRDTVAKVEGGSGKINTQILRIANDPLVSGFNKTDWLRDAGKTSADSKNNKTQESASTRQTINKANSTGITKETIEPNNIHVATEEDYNKLRYIKRKEIEENAVKKEVVSTHHEAECNEEKKCPKNKYCRNFHCFEAHRKHHECDEDDECADDMPCIYGRCDDKPKGSPGGICEKDGDCGDGCCVIEPTIDERHGTCKNKLEEFHQCSPVLFRKVWIGEDKPECGPCADGLECVERGIHSSHLVCMKKK